MISSSEMAQKPSATNEEDDLTNKLMTDFKEVIVYIEYIFSSLEISLFCFLFD